MRWYVCIYMWIQTGDRSLGMGRFNQFSFNSDFLVVREQLLMFVHNLVISRAYKCKDLHALTTDCGK